VSPLAGAPSASLLSPAFAVDDAALPSVALGFVEAVSPLVAVGVDAPLFVALVLAPVDEDVVEGEVVA
jgi:hypothetical protein